MKLSKQALDGNMETLLLAVLEGGPSYGYQIVQDLNQKAPGVLQTGEGTVYPILHRLEEKGLVQSEWRKGDSGRQRRYYRLTAKGRKALAGHSREWLALSRVMHAFLDPQLNPQPGRAG